ncbi:MAG: hypothetical protein IPH31_19815 [Lewinellaceae bacterium]|nr:hypothetical protein [Lewinellaceae bacterium]
MPSFAQVSDCKKVVPACFDNTLFYKGFLLNAANQVKRLAFSDSITTEKFNLLKSYERRLAAQYTQPIADRDSTEVTELEAQVNDLEKDLARTVAGYGEAMRQVNWQEVQQKLVAGEAAVEFVRYQFIEKRQSDTMYAALLLLPEMEQPEFIPLFKETQLDSLLSRLLGSGTAAKADNLYAARSIIPIPQKTNCPKTCSNFYGNRWKSR